MRSLSRTLILALGTLVLAVPAHAQYGYGGGYGSGGYGGYGGPGRYEGNDGYGGGYGYGRGYRAEAGGSYRRTCTQIEQRGPYLRALCRDRDGDYVPSRIDTRGCDGGIANRNGRLVC